MKKLLISTLVAVMVLSFGATAFADAGDIADPAFNDIAGHEAEAELTLLGALGVFEGETGLGGAVNPDDPLTRAQFCKVVVEAFGRGSTAEGLMGLEPTFTDEVPTWAWGYVNTAVFMGVINGYPDGTFGANNPVTYGEAVTMLVRAAGHEKLVPEGVWPYNFVFYAVDKEFVGGVDVGFTNLPCTRGDMARLLVGAMLVPHATVGAESVSFDNAELEEGVNAFTGLFKGYDAVNAKVTIGTYGAMDAADPVYLMGADGYADLVNNKVWAVADADGDIVYIERLYGDVVTGIYKTSDIDDDDYAYIELKDGTEVYFDDTAGVPVELNLADAPLNHVDDSVTPLHPGDELTINVDKYGWAVQIYALRWDLINAGTDVYSNGYWDYITKVEESKVVDETEYNTKVTFYADSAFMYDDDPSSTLNLVALDSVVLQIPKTAQVTINGALADRDDLEKGDVIKVATKGANGYDASSIIAVAATRDTVEGTVTGTREHTTALGTVTYVTVKVGEESEEYACNGTYVAGASPGTLHKYSLDEEGDLFFDVAYGSANPIVLVTGKSIQEYSGTTPTDYFITVDELGVEKTYEVLVGTGGLAEGDFTSLGTNDFYVLYIDQGTGLVYDVQGFSGHGPSPYEWTVYGKGDDSCTIYNVTDGTQFIVAPIAVYSLDSSSGTDVYTYIGLEGLVAGTTDGDTVVVSEYDDAGDYWWLLIRDDTPPS